MVVPTPVRFKKSAMPFIQMENIAHFLRACELPPLDMPSHDRFLTVDLFESKDPAQVLQCLAAFSRAANTISPARFPTSIGPRRGGSVLSPTTTTTTSTTTTTPSRPDFARSHGSSTFNPMKPPPNKPTPKPLSPARTGGSTASRNSASMPGSPGGVSSWSRRSDQGVTSPAWNIHQYGYMGGASQGNQGIAFGARRQITSASPHVPTMAEKERRRREKADEDERLRVAADEAENHRRVEREADEERQRAEEERLWEEESRKQREAKERRLDEQKREWEEQERQWKMQEEARQKEERNAQEAADREARRKRAGSDARLRGQYLSQYQAEQQPHSRPSSQAGDHTDRIAELERQLEEAKERERQYQAERETRKQRARSKSRSRPQPPPRAPSPQESNVSWAQADDRAYLRDAWETNQREPPSRILHTPEPSTRSLPEPTSPRPLPDPTAYMKTSTSSSRTDRFLASNPAPLPPKPTTHAPPELTSTNEFRAEEARRKESQQSNKDRAWAGKSLLEREMERERERQKEWETTQRELASVPRDSAAGTGEGQTWDVNQYGFLGGDSQNRGARGIGIGGKRQILGPRPFGGR